MGILRSIASTHRHDEANDLTSALEARFHQRP
jgi:hypothetical protein